jgi:hypothetical protein
MANVLYPLWKQELLKGTAATPILTTGSPTKAVLVTSSYTYSAAHQYYSSVTGTVTTPTALASITWTNGTITAASVTFTAVAAGSTFNAIILFNDTGSAATSPLVMYMDTGVTNLPVASNGGNIVINWNGSGIFAL